MRRLIGLLLALNLGMLFAGLALQHWPQRAPEALFNAEKIRLLSAPTSHVPSLAEAPPAANSEPAEAKLASQDNALSRCMSWASLDVAGLLAVEAKLKQAGIPVAAYDIELDKKLGWWVFVPPENNALAAQGRIDEFVRLGINDYALVRGGSMRNAVSLGAFGRLVQARMHAARMADTGIADVQFGPRPEAGVARLIIAPSVTEAALVKLQKTWPKGLQPVQCAD